MGVEGRGNYIKKYSAYLLRVTIRRMHGMKNIYFWKIQHASNLHFINDNFWLFFVKIKKLRTEDSFKI
jgi:hypothetical protein